MRIGPNPRYGQIRNRRKLGSLSIATAKSHVSRLLTKLGARDRAQLVIAAYEAGLVTLGAS